MYSHPEARAKWVFLGKENHIFFSTAINPPPPPKSWNSNTHVCVVFTMVLGLNLTCG